MQPSTGWPAPISSTKNSPWSRLPISRPCMSVKATTTVSIAPDSTSAFSSSKPSTEAILTFVTSDTLTTLVPDARNSADTTPTLGRADGTGTTCGQLPHRRGREDPPQARLRAGALPRDGRLPELRDLLHDHLDPGGLPHVVLHRLRPGRRGRGQLGLAARRRDEHHRLPGDGGDRVRLPDGGRALLLGLEARQPRLGLVHGLVQPDRPDRGHGGDRLRPGDVRDGAPELLVRVSEHEGVHLPPLRDLPRVGAGREPDAGQLHGAPEYDLRVLAHRGRDLHRDRAAGRAGQPPVIGLRLRRDGECLRLRESGR